MPDRPARLLVVVPSETAPPARLGEWLRAAGLELDERHLDAGDEIPADLTGHDGLLVTGGPQSSLDDDATELAPVRALLARAIADDAPTLGICLGAQLMAQAGGGRVRVGADGPEVGAALVARRDAAESGERTSTRADWPLFALYDGSRTSAERLARPQVAAVGASVPASSRR